MKQNKKWKDIEIEFRMPSRGCMDIRLKERRGSRIIFCDDEGKKIDDTKRKRVSNCWMRKR